MLTTSKVSEVERIFAGFEACTLLKAEWTHRAHLVVALCYLTRYPYSEALEHVRAGILRLNVALGGENTPTSGYHETLTRFWMHTIKTYIDNHPGEDLEKLAEGVSATFSDSRYPLRHYSRSLLFSPEARAGWVEPDLQPLQ